MFDEFYTYYIFHLMYFFMAASRLNAPNEKVHPKELTPRDTQHKNKIQRMQMFVVFMTIGFAITGAFILDTWWHALVIPLMGAIIGLALPIFPLCFFKKYTISLMWIHDKMVTYFGIVGTIPVCVLLVLDLYNITTNIFHIIAIGITYTLSLLFAFVLFKRDCKILEEIKKEENTQGEYVKRFRAWWDGQKPNYKITLDSICQHLNYGEVCGINVGSHYSIVTQKLLDFGLITEHIKNTWNDKTTGFSSKCIDGIKELKFVFEDSKLRYIYIDLYNDNQGAWAWKNLYNSLYANYEEPLYDKEAGLFNWTCGNTIYTLSEEGLIVGQLTI